MNSRLLQNTGYLAVSVLCSLVLLGQSIAEGSSTARESDTGSMRYSAELAVYGPKKQISLKPITSKTAYLTIPSTSNSELLPIANHPSFTDRHKELSDMVLRALPSGCRDNLRNYYIVYTGTDHRGLGGKTTIILDGTVPDDEFIALLTHECAHVIHSNMPGTPESGPSVYKDGKMTFYNDSPMTGFYSISWATETTLRSGQKKANFASGYGKTNAFEDFAEMFAAYVFQRDMLRERAASNPYIAAKLAWFEAFLPMEDDIFGNSTYDWTGTVPWDVTRLPYIRN